LKRLLVTLRRVLSPQRDVVGLLARRGVPHVQERTALYFRDVYDHLVRVAEQLEAARDLVSSVMEVYLSVIANRTGDITKQLTIFASIFMPLSFIVGFFGENFEGIAPHAMFWPAMVTMALVPVGMLMWFKHKGWS
jgi:magnesium transporter